MRPRQYRRYLQEAPDAADRAEIEAAADPAGAATAVKPPRPSREPAKPRESSARRPRLPCLRRPGPRTPAAPTREQPTGSRRRDESGWTRYGLTARDLDRGSGHSAAGTAGLFAAAAASDADDIKRLQMYRSMTGAPATYSSVASQYEQALDDGERHARYAKIALAGAGVAAAVAATFFVLDAKRTREPAVAIVPSAGGLAAAGTWRF